MLPESPKSKLRKMILQFIRERLKTNDVVEAADIAKKFGISKEKAIELMK